MLSLPDTNKRDFIKILSSFDFSIIHNDRKILQFRKWFNGPFITIPNSSIVTGEILKSALIQGNISIADYIEKFKSLSKIEGKDSIFALVDILGFKGLIQNAGKNEKKVNIILNRLNKGLKPAYSQISENVEMSRKYNWMDNSGLHIYSDNILLVRAVGERNYGEPEIGNTISQIVSYQLSLALNGFFSRGAIVRGFGYSDRHLIFGLPLLDAYKLETKRAKYPRIILCDDMKRSIERISTMYYDPGSCPFASLILKTDDDILFINYLFELWQFSEDMIDFYRRQKPDNPIAKMNYYPEAVSLLESHRNHISKNLKKFKGANPYVYRKYFWLAQYHNFFVRQFFTDIPDLKISTIKQTVQFSFPIWDSIQNRMKLIKKTQEPDVDGIIIKKLSPDVSLNDIAFLKSK
jgi:hypothetical protein